MMADVLDFNDAPSLRVIDPKEFERRIDELRRDLTGRAEEFVRDIFPSARIQGDEARVGNLEGEPGESLSIGLSGARAGLWFDHATGQGGDIIDLWRQSLNYGDGDFLKVVEDLERWAGRASAPRWSSKVHKVGQERRKAAAEAPARQPDTFGEQTGAWRYLDPAGGLLATVKRFDAPGGKKTYRPFLASGAAGMPDVRPLYRQPDLAGADRVVLVEGEKCADALAAIGIVATTQMGGASANPAKTDWSPLAGKQVIIWPDNDEPGLAMPAKVRPALEAVGARVAVLTPPADKPAKWDAADAVAEGFDVGPLLETPRARPLIPIYSRRQLRELKRPEWLIDEVIVESSVIALYGPSGSLKSFVAIDLSMSVACGVAWHGREVKQGPVVYVTGEGRDQIDARLTAWEQLNAFDGDAPIYVVPMGVSISDPQWVGHLIDAVQQVTGGAAPAMIWLDTLARTFGAGDENSQKDMNAFIGGMDRLRDTFRCVVGVVHHTGKEDAKGLRGSSALYAAMDTVVRTDRSAGNLHVTLKNAQPHGKQKDAAEFEDIALEAKVVGLGITDKKGREVTSLALVPAEARAKPEAEPKPQRLGSNQEAVLSAIRKAAQSDQALSFMRLSAMTGLNDGSLSRTLQNLTDRGLISETETEGRKCWMFP